jgi:hypothetical protein
MTQPSDFEEPHFASMIARLEEIAASLVESDPVAEADNVRADLRTIAHALRWLLLQGPQP